MLSQIYVARVERQIRSSGDLLSYIAKRSWEPSVEELERFCQETYAMIIDKYRDLESPDGLVNTGQLLFAEAAASHETLAYVAGGGLAPTEEIATKFVGYGLLQLLKVYAEHPKPFDFKLVVVGDLGEGDDGGGQYMPVASGF